VCTQGRTVTQLNMLSVMTSANVHTNRPRRDRGHDCTTTAALRRGHPRCVDKNEARSRYAGAKTCMRCDAAPLRAVSHTIPKHKRMRWCTRSARPCTVRRGVASNVVRVMFGACRTMLLFVHHKFHNSRRAGQFDWTQVWHGKQMTDSLDH
jgi:hypothetical protein